MIHMADLFFIMKRRERRRGKDQERKVVLRCVDKELLEDEKMRKEVHNKYTCRN